MEIRRQAIAGALAAGAAVLWLRRFPPERYAFYPVCPLRALTGWHCPGCGSTHALAALLAGRFGDAVRDNPLAVALVIVLVALGTLELYSALRWNRWRPIRIPRPAVALALTAAVLFGLLRNIT